MIALKTIPEGIGKHIVCIYAHRTAAGDIKTVSGRTPNPHSDEREDYKQDQD